MVIPNTLTRAAGYGSLLLVTILHVGIVGGAFTVALRLLIEAEPAPVAAAVALAIAGTVLHPRFDRFGTRCARLAVRRHA